MPKLTVVAVRNAQPQAKAYKLADGKGLVLQVMPNGAKYWRLRYRFAGKENTFGLGVFPEVGLADARAACDAARRTLAAGIDPSQQRRVEKLASATAADHSLEVVAREWHTLHKVEWADSYAERIIGAFERDIFPWLGRQPVGTVEPRDLLARLQQVQQRGAKETAHRLRRWLSPVFRHAIVKGLCSRDPAADLKGALQGVIKHHYPTLTDPARIGELLRAIEGYAGNYTTRAALKLSPLLFCRPGELRWATWSEFDLDGALWTVPAQRMKRRKQQKETGDPHLVPLSRQAVALLRDLYPLTGHSVAGYLFPGERDARRPISENTVNAALHGMGFRGEIVAHGFRHMASTALNEMGRWRPDVIEAQLAHKDENLIRGTYNQAEYLTERRPMMQAWADYLDQLRTLPPASAPARSPAAA